MAWLIWEQVYVCLAGELGSSVIFHRPLVQPRKPVMMTWLYFKMFKLELVKMAMKLPAQSCSMDMRYLVVMSLKTWADCALG